MISTAHIPFPISVSYPFKIIPFRTGMFCVFGIAPFDTLEGAQMANQHQTSLYSVCTMD